MQASEDGRQARRTAELNSTILPAAVAGEIPIVVRHLCRERGLRPPNVCDQGQATGAWVSSIRVHGCGYCTDIIELLFIWRCS